MKIKTKISKTAIFSFSLLLLTALILPCLAACDNGNMYVDIPKIGKADCAVIRCGDFTAVIDCGESDDGEEICEKLEAYGTEKINLLIITHYDKDHIGGAAKVIESFETERLVAADYTPETESDEYIAYKYAAENAGITPELVSDELHIEYGEISIDIYGAMGRSYPNNSDNNSSLVCYIEYAENNLMFAGDIEKQRIYDMISDGLVKNCDFIKIPHHGAYNDNTEKLLSAVGAKYGVICCSEKNPPDDETFDALVKTGTEAFLTANGDVHITVNKDGISVSQ